MELNVRQAADAAALRLRGPASAVYHARSCLRGQVLLHHREATVLALATLDTLKLKGDGNCAAWQSVCKRSKNLIVERSLMEEAMFISLSSDLRSATTFLCAR